MEIKHSFLSMKNKKRKKNLWGMVRDELQQGKDS